MTVAPLVGRTVVTTRQHPGALDALLAAAGADVVHLPLIEIGEPPDGGVALAAALATLGSADWLVVTSVPGARCVGTAAAMFPALRLGAVGARTAAELAELADRAVEVVPDRQTAADLVEMMPPGGGERVVLAQAEQADGTIVEGLVDRGYQVDVVTAYATRSRMPEPTAAARARAADVVTFASGSAALAWREHVGVDTPPVAVAIGPTTRDVAQGCGLKITHTAADHSVEGLAAAVVAAVRPRSYN